MFLSRAVAVRRSFLRRHRHGSAVASDFVQPLEARRLLAADVVISEIMHHAPSNDPREEFVELYNRGDAPADLTGWRFDQGVSFNLPSQTLGAGQYLVVAADVARFSAKYPGVNNVVGNWTGGLSNAREDVRVVDAAGNTVDKVEYADSGDWSKRRRGELDFGHMGWDWVQPADGQGPSLELINPALTNDTGENWASSTLNGGTPGRANSVASPDVAPLIRDVIHSPAVPHSTDSVTVTARVNDELGAPSSVTLHYRVDSLSPGSFITLAMRDDGAAGDAVAGDGTYTAVLPPQPDKAVVEFYVRAADATGHSRTWPAPTDDFGTQGANALYQVDNGVYAGPLPIYRLIMTEAERAELADIGNGGPNSDHQSNARMNATFVGVDGTGTEVHYEAGVRNRGHGTRLGPPNNYHVQFASDNPWHGQGEVNFNAYYTHSQLLGSAVRRLAGDEAPDAMGVELRVNGADLATNDALMFGSYVMVEEANSDFTDEHFPGDGGGNYYAAFRTDPPAVYQEGDLRYEGTNPDAYRDTYFKKTNTGEDDWSDLIHLTDVLNNAPDATYVHDVSQVIDLPQWLRYLALDELMLNQETGLVRGMGDDYGMYRGEKDTRFRLVPHDLDTLFNQGNSQAPYNASIFSVVDGYNGTDGVEGLKRLLNHPDVVPMYYQAFVDLIRDVFNPQVLNPVIDNLLGPFVDPARITDIKNFVVQRAQGVLAQIPRQFTINSWLPFSGPYRRTTAPNAILNGTADALTTHSVTVNGLPAQYAPKTGAWSIGSAVPQPVTLVPTGATWKYLANGSNQGTAWHALNYAETGWSAGGPGVLGWGDSQRTQVPQAPTRVTTYFRHTFNVSDPSRYGTLTFRLLRDDGAVVWLNGQKLFGSNMPDSVAFDTRPLATVSGSDESKYFTYTFPASGLVPGNNILAVEVHDVSASSDLSFDLGLDATPVSTGTGTGVPLTPGVNRLTVQAFDGPNGTGNEVSRGFVDVWYDAPGNSTSTAPVDAVSLLTTDSYRPGTAVLVQVSALNAGQVQRELWDATATLSVNRPDVFLDTTQVTLRNGLGSALVRVSGPGVDSGATFTITASVAGHQANKSMSSLAAVPVTNVSGTLPGTATTWSGVVHVTGDVIVPAGHTLTIQPGTLVLLNGVASGSLGTDIEVDGTIRSLGTADRPVTFTAWDPNLPWGELRHQSAQPSLYQYTLITRAGNSPGGGHTGFGPVLRPTNSTITFDHVAITDNAGKIGQSVGSNLTFLNSELSRSIAGAEVEATALRQDWTWTTEMRGVDDNDGIYLHGQQAGQSITLSHDVFAGVDDDGIDTLGSNVLIDDNIVRDAKDKGISTLAGVVTINNSLIVDNTLAPEDGTSASISAKAGVGYTTATVNMDHTTVVAPVVGIEARDKFGEPNNVIVFNVKNSIIRAPDPVRTDYNPADIHISYSNVAEAWPGTGNVTADPLFTNPSAHDFHLRPGSPSLNAGDPASPNDPDGTRADQGFWRTGAKQDAGSGTIAGGTLPAGTTVLSPNGGPYHVTGDVVVPAGATLQILPGTTLFFDPGSGITVDGGRLLAEGTQYHEIRFTLDPAATATWDGIQFVNSTQDNRITWAVLEYGSPTPNTGMVGLTGSNLLLDHDYFDHADRRRIRTENSSLIVRNSEFADMFPNGQAPTTNNFSEHIWGNGIPAGGQLVIENNVFGVVKGHNDAIDFGVAQRPGPIPQILNNLFKGGGDDALDLEADAHVEGNTFLHFHKDQYNTDPGNSNGISAGGGRDYTVARNVFYDVDNAVLVKDGAFLTFQNNTVASATINGIYFELAGDTVTPGRGASVDSSIFTGVTTAFGAISPTTTLTVNRSVVPAADVARGVGNTSEDPRLKDVAKLDFTLRPGSPALGSGTNGIDMGAKVAPGVSLGGVPVGTTGRRGATVVVDGPGLNAYRYRVDGGAWSLPRTLATPITLSGLADGTHTLQVVGRNSAGAWQPDDEAVTRTWTVNTSVPAVRINEVLAVNTATVEHGGFPDLIELYNDSDSAIDLSGMSITDDAADPRKFVFPAGTTIGSGQYLTLYGDSRSVAGELHVRFSLRAGGEGVFLFNSPGRGGAMLDSVVFGPQISDLSIGRLADGTWGLTRPTFGAANVAQRTGDRSTLKLNEWLAEGAAPNGDDFIELYNPDPLPVPMGGLALTDHIGGAPLRSPVSPLSFIPARGFFAFTADGSGKDADHANFKLSPDSGQLALFDAATKKPIDRLVYGPQHTGVSQGRSPDGGNGIATFPVPTPGASNAQFAPSALPLRVTEIMYHPAEPTSGEYNDKDLEFVELQNTGTSAISLHGVKFTAGVEFVFPDMTLQPGQYVVVAANRAAFLAKYGAGRPLVGEYDGDLDNSGERLRLEDDAGATILDFAYGDNAWYPLTDGVGYSLVINNPQGAAATWGEPQSWHVGSAPGGSPGTADGPTAAAVLARHVFYNHSSFDQNNAAANAADDSALAVDKPALLPGAAASFLNYTSYSRGINGIFVDVLHFAGTPTAADFGIRVGNGGDPGTWATGPVPSAVTLRPGAGVGGSDRITLVWPDGAIKNEWVQVTVKPGARTGIASPDVFYFGNLIGETGDNAAVAAVNALDVAAARRALSNRAVGVTSVYDFDRDRRVTSRDVLALRNNLLKPNLRLFTAPAAAPAGLFAETPIAKLRDRATQVL